MKIRAFGTIATLALSLLPPSWALAQSVDGIVDRIKEKNTISIGYRDASIPFSYVDGKGQPLGYSTDI